MAKPIALITSASGRIGKELVALLAKEGTFAVRACCFSMEKADSLKAIGAHEVVKFDLNDSATWGTALEGVSAVYSASLDPMLEGHLAFSKELGNRVDQIKHVVRVSCMGADTNTASYDPEVHSSRKGAAIPLMLTNGFYCRCSPDFYNLTGTKPTSYYDYLVTPGANGETGLDELWQGNLWKKGEHAMNAAAELKK